jgi:uncharacterized phage protein gp47/JayE
MALFARSFEQLVADAIGDLTTNTPISRLSAGGIARSLLEAVNRRLAEAYDTFDLNLARAFVSASSGQYLELIGVLLGVERGTTGSATTSAQEQIIKFYVDSGNFGSINGGNDIVLTQGTIISSLANSAGVSYRLTEQPILGSTQNTAWVSAEAVIPGEDSNVGSDTLVYHNFIGYTDYANSSLKVTNVYPIANGQNFESDANFKFRIVNRVLEAEAANITAIRLAILSTAGVADVILLPRYRGIGTVGAILKSITPTVSTTLISNVQANLNGVEAYGNIAYVRGPREIGLTMKITVQYDSQLSDEELSSIEADIVTSITDYVNNLDIGEDFILNRLVSQLFSVSTHITNFGVSGKPIDELYIWRPSALQDTKVRELLLNDYYPAGDERVIIEPSVAEPITLVRSFVGRK